MPSRTIQQVLDEHTDSWTSLDGVVGVAIGEHEGSPCIKVYIDEDADPAAIRAHVPESIDGHAIVIQRIGQLRAL